MFDNRLIPGLLLSLVIVSQSLLAVAAPCFQLVAPSHSVPAATADDPHAGHHLDDAPAGETASCCDGGYCSLGGCLPFSALASGELAVPLPFSAPVAPARGISMEDAGPETLYRPPITG